jgi:hypothetical protein
MVTFSNVTTVYEFDFRIKFKGAVVATVTILKSNVVSAIIVC